MVWTDRYNSANGDHAAAENGFNEGFHYNVSIVGVEGFVSLHKSMLL